MRSKEEEESNAHWTYHLISIPSHERTVPVQCHQISRRWSHFPPCNPAENRDYCEHFMVPYAAGTIKVAAAEPLNWQWTLRLIMGWMPVLIPAHRKIDFTGWYWLIFSAADFVEWWRVYLLQFQLLEWAHKPQHKTLQRCKMDCSRTLGTIWTTFFPVEQII